MKKKKELLQGAESSGAGGTQERGTKERGVEVENGKVETKTIDALLLSIHLHKLLSFLARELLGRLAASPRRQPAVGLRSQADAEGEARSDEGEVPE